MPEINPPRDVGLFRKASLRWLLLWVISTVVSGFIALKCTGLPPSLLGRYVFATPLLLAICLAWFGWRDFRKDRPAQKWGTSFGETAQELCAYHDIHWLIVVIGSIAIMALTFEGKEQITLHEVLDQAAPDILQLFLVWAVVLFIVTLFSRHDQMLNRTKELADKVDDYLPKAGELLGRTVTTAVLAAELIGMKTKADALKNLAEKQPQTLKLLSHVAYQYSSYTQALVEKLRPAELILPPLRSRQRL
jgi:hypothetical protein